MSRRRPKGVSRAEWREAQRQADRLRTMTKEWMHLLVSDASPDVCHHAWREIITTAGPTRFAQIVYSLAATASDMAHRATCDGDCDGNGVFMVVRRGSDGELHQADPSDAPPAAAAAGRFIVAAMSKDAETALAIWRTVPADPEHFGPFLGAVTETTVGLVRKAHAATGGETS